MNAAECREAPDRPLVSTLHRLAHVRAIWGRPLDCHLPLQGAGKAAGLRPPRLPLPAGDAHARTSGQPPPNDKLETVDSRALEQRIRLDFPSSVWQIGTLTRNLPNDRHAQQDRTMSVEPACVVHSADPNAGYALLLHRQRGVSMSVRASTMPA